LGIKYLLVNKLAADKDLVYIRIADQKCRYIRNQPSWLRAGSFLGLRS
jgi:hypothetical protein